MALTTLKHITVSPENYHALKEYGKMGDSFNDVITEGSKKSKDSRS